MGPRTVRPRRFGFYRRLTHSQKHEYDRSDALREIRLPADRRLGEAANRVVSALTAAKPALVRVAAEELVGRICAGVGPTDGREPERPPRVRILRRRPRRSGGEFHGLYTRHGEGRCEIRVWMFTAAHQDVVRPRTFLRTLLHEVVHHLDFAVYDLPSSFHTLGFHARESALLRALERSGARIPGTRRSSPQSREEVRRSAPPAPRGASVPSARTPGSGPDQLLLFQI